MFTFAIAEAIYSVSSHQGEIKCLLYKRKATMIKIVEALMNEDKGKEDCFPKHVVVRQPSKK